jgi:hypothetical protein
MNDTIPGAKVEGTVMIDGVNVYGSDVNVAVLRGMVGMVFQKQNPFPKSIFDNVAYGPRLHGITDKAVLENVVEESLKKAAIWDEVKGVWTRDIFRDVFIHRAKELTRPEDYINHSLYFEAKTFLQGLLLMEDKLSMAHGLETRVPFLDNNLVDFAMRLPVHLKLANLGKVTRLNENVIGKKTDIFYNENRDGKLLLRQVMARHIDISFGYGEKYVHAFTGAGFPVQG